MEQLVLLKKQIDIKKSHQWGFIAHIIVFKKTDSSAGNFGMSFLFFNICNLCSSLKARSRFAPLQTKW
jgi:hypothetical protein